MSNTIEVGVKVERIAKDYTGGRKGEVIEVTGERPTNIPGIMAEPRARVAWFQESDGQPMKLRTWVRFSDLKPYEEKT